MWQLTTYCHLRPPDAIPLLTYIFGETREHQRPNFDGFIYTRYAVSPYTAPVISILAFGEAGVPFADLRMQHRAMNQNAEFTEGG